MFGRRRTTTTDLRDWVDDLDLDEPIDSGAEDEIRALMSSTPLPVRAATDYEDTVPRALPPRVPQRRGPLDRLLGRSR